MFGLKEDGRKALEKKEGREKKSLLFFWLERNWGIKRIMEGIHVHWTHHFFPFQIGKKWESGEDFLWGSPISFSFFFLKKHYFLLFYLINQTPWKKTIPFFLSFLLSFSFSSPFFLPNMITQENNCSYSRAYHRHM